MPRLTVGQVDIHYETGGPADGTRVLYISGTGGDLRVRPGPLDSPLVSGFHVLAYDQRGLGRSSVPPGPYTMADYADDAAALLQSLGWAGAAIVGVSFGGMVAQELALRHPALVTRLVLACTSSGGAGGASYPLHQLFDLALEERIVQLIQLADQRIDDAWRATHPVEWERTLATYRARVSVGAGEPGRETGARLQLEARRGHDTWDRLGRISCPTLVCGGRHDGIAPPDNLERLASAIPGARLETFEGGHLFLLQDPAAYTAVAKFLQEAGPVGASTPGGAEPRAAETS